MNSLKTKKLEIEIVERPDYKWALLVPASSVRIGETSRELVKSKDCVDYLRHVMLFVGKSRWECKKWLDEHKQVVLKLGIPYEVS
jgi:hypothetical protein